MAPQNRRLGFFVLGTMLAAGLSMILIPALTVWDLRPGSPLGQIIGIMAAVLLMWGLRYPFIRRTSRPPGRKSSAQQWHGLMGALGVGFALVHSQAALREWSTLVLLASIGLLFSGLYGHLVSPRRVALGFGADALPYARNVSAAPWTGDERGRHLAEKRRILGELGADTTEPCFVLRRQHWLTHPWKAWSYRRLSRRERAIHRQQPESAVSRIAPADRLWRRSHLLLAPLFVIGLVSHLITVLFFAGYVADGREIYWWHFTSW